MIVLSPSVLLAWARTRIGGAPQSLAFARLVKHDVATSPRGITCRGKDDGGGAQVHAVISALALAHATGLTYYHSPFTSIAHAEGDAADWTEKWESFFNLGHGEKRLRAEQEAECVPIKRLLKSPLLWRGHELIAEAEHFTGFTDADVEAIAAVLPDVRRKYALSDKSALTLYNVPGTLTMNVHVRRGDVSADHPYHSNRFTGDDAILETIRSAREAAQAQGLAVSVNVWSQGDRADFLAYEEAGCRLFLDTDIFETVHNLAQSDILLMAKSSLSFVAALLNDGICLYEDFWHPPLPHWIKLQNPAASSAALRDALAVRSRGTPAG
ncbi:hypothetical protein FHS78_002341 [Parvibaculum indicum]|nr:hypothetical protein [Parvibaculum indicum]